MLNFLNFTMVVIRFANLFYEFYNSPHYITFVFKSISNNDIKKKKSFSNVIKPGSKSVGPLNAGDKWSTHYYLLVLLLAEKLKRSPLHMWNPNNCLLLSIIQFHPPRNPHFLTIQLHGHVPFQLVCGYIYR